MNYTVTNSKTGKVILTIKDGSLDFITSELCRFSPSSGLKGFVRNRCYTVSGEIKNLTELPEGDIRVVLTDDLNDRKAVGKMTMNCQGISISQIVSSIET